jgi:hypothetical protein
VIGTGSRAAHIEALVAKRGHASNIQVVGYLPMGGSHHFVDHARILDTTDTLPELVARLQSVKSSWPYATAAAAACRCRNCSSASCAGFASWNCPASSSAKTAICNSTR